MLDATLLLLHEVFPYKRYGKSCITDMTLMLLAARESHPLFGPDMLAQMDDNQVNKKQTWVQKHAQRPKQEPPSELPRLSTLTFLIASSHLKSSSLTTATRQPAVLYNILFLASSTISLKQ